MSARADGENVVQTHSRIRQDLWKKVKVFAILEDKSESEIVEDAIQLLIDSKERLPLKSSK